MRFLVPVNVAEEGESQTVHIIETDSNCHRTNKKKLRSYFKAVGVPANDIKRVMKLMGFWGVTLGRKDKTTKSTT